MDYATFEARVMELLFKTSSKLTAPFVAYRVGCGVEVARTFLEKMVSSEILNMEVDDNGAIHFDLADRPPATNEPLSWHAAATPAPAPDPASTAMVYTPAAPLQIHIQHLAPEKSPALAGVLGLLFGPLGMVYSTIPGALVMFFASCLVVPLTLGLGLFVTAPQCAIWAASAASAHNARARRITVLGPHANPPGPLPLPPGQ